MNFTTVNPPPGLEGDTISIIESMFPDFIRLSDDDDQTLFTGEYIIAFEDNPYPVGDFDFNDYITKVILKDGVLLDSQFVGSWSSVSQNMQYVNGIFSDTTVLGTSYSVPTLNVAGKDMMITYVKAPATIPEPSTIVLFAAALISYGIWKFVKDFMRE